MSFKFWALLNGGDWGGGDGKLVPDRLGKEDRVGKEERKALG